jgi:5-hydroxyisourate hydrolase
MAARLTTHVLDTACGRPARGMKVECYRVLPTGVAMLAQTVTNEDGRTPSPLLSGTAMIAGPYRLLFHVGEYFAAGKHPDALRFLDIVPIQFTIDDVALAYHVPLLVSPWAYSTYRGS